jgi:hypothetical protein
LLNIKFTYKDTVKYDLLLRGRITVIDGDSGTGKTFLWNYLNIINGKDVIAKEGDVDHAFPELLLINAYNVASIKTSLFMGKDMLVVIDNADSVFLIHKDVLSFVVSDLKNSYIIFARSDYDFSISPNYYASMNFDKKSKAVKLDYVASEPGWY